MNMNRTLILVLVLLFHLIPSALFSQARMTAETRYHIQQLIDNALSEGVLDVHKVREEMRLFLVEHTEGVFLNVLGFKNHRYRKEELIASGIKVTAEAGRVVNLHVPAHRLSLLFQITSFDIIDLPQVLSPDLNVMNKDVRADSVHAGVMLDASYTGKDVIMGIIDWGFDFNHPVFYDSTLSRHRILGCWDHFKRSGPAPEGFGYGTEYMGFDALMQAGSDTANLRGYDTHGTHVAGIAGGGGGGLGLMGVAPECDFLFLQVDWQTGTFLDAVEWMYRISLKEKKRLVINMSFGSYHRGTLDSHSFFHEVIRHYTRLGVCMVTSAGNNGNQSMHIYHAFDDTDSVFSEVSMLPNTTTFEGYNGHRVILWGDKGASFSAGLDVYQPSGMSLLQRGPYWNTLAGSYHKDTFMMAGQDTLYLEVSVESSHPINGKPYVSFVIRRPGQRLPVVLKLKGEKVGIHAWNIIQTVRGSSNTGQPFVASRNGWLRGDNAFTLSDPGVIEDVIAVGAHNPMIFNRDGEAFPGALSLFSSRGPTMDGLLKPDVTAPGSDILSAVSRFTTRSFSMDSSVFFQGETYPFSRFSGTSMSGPAVAGVCALILEANPSLSHQQVKEVLIGSARADIRTGTIPNQDWGYGKATATKAIQMALSQDGGFLHAFPPGVVYPNPSTGLLYFKSAQFQSVPVQVYDMKGRLLLTSVIANGVALDGTSLPTGLYVVRVQDQGKWYYFKWVKS